MIAPWSPTVQRSTKYGRPDLAQSHVLGRNARGGGGGGGVRFSRWLVFEVGFVHDSMIAVR